MVKRIKLRRKKNWFKKIFGRSFGLWDIIVIVILAIYIIYTFKTEGYWGIFSMFAGALFFAYVVSVVISHVKNKVKK